MTPTIVLKDGKLFMTLGAPGGPRITTAVLQTILNVVDFHMNIQDAVDAPRFHHQWEPDILYLENGISPDTIALLEQRGYKIDHSPGVVLARMSAIMVEDHNTGSETNRAKKVIDGKWLAGAADGRWSGKAAGY